MTTSTDPTRIVEVAVGIVVDKMSPDCGPAGDPNDSSNATHATPPPRILITRRKPEQVLGGYWELPGGKLEPNETPAQAVVRELHEEVGIDVATLATLDTVDHRYDHAHVRLIPFICKHLAGTPRPLQVDAVRWAAPDTLADYTFPQASQPIITQLIRWLDTADLSQLLSQDKP